MKIKYCLRILGTLLILAICFKFIDLREIWNLLKQIDMIFYLPSLLIVATGFIFVLIFIEKKIFNHYRISVELLELIKIKLTLSFYALLFPRPVTMGIRWRKYAKFCSAREGGLVILAENFIQVTGIALTGLFFFIIEIKNIKNHAYIIPMILIIATAGIIFLIIRNSPWRTSIEEIKNRAIIKIMVFSLAGNLIFILAHYLLIKAFGFDISFAAIAWVRSLAVLVQLLPVTIAGLGLREGSYMILLSLYGVDQAGAFAYSLALFSYSIAWALIGALIELTDSLSIWGKAKISS